MSVLDGAGSRRRRDTGGRALAALAVVAVLVLAVLVPSARRSLWTQECQQQGGRLEQSAADIDPVVTPQSRIVYTCYGTNGQVLDDWQW